MRDATHELEHVRRVGRLLLLGQRLAQWVAVLLIVAVVCGVIDYVPAVARMDSVGGGGDGCVVGSDLIDRACSVGGEFSSGVGGVGVACGTVIPTA